MIVLVIGGTALGYALAGGDKPAGTPAAATTTTPALSPEAQVECVNVEKAYNAWNGIRSIKTAADVTALNDLTGEMLADDGKTFLDAVSGYNDQPSKELAVAIASYNFELSLIKFQLTVGGKIVDSEQPAKVAEAAGKVRDAYAAFRKDTCRA